MAWIEEVIEQYPYLGRDDLIPVLQEVQKKQGYISEDVIAVLSKKLGIPTSKIYGITTFYSDFSFHKPGRYHINVCRGTGCHLNRSSLILRELKKQLDVEEKVPTKDGLFSYQSTQCMGACHRGPIITINDEYHCDMDAAKLIEKLDQLRNLEG